MIPEIGHFALMLAFLVAILQGALPLVGAHRNRGAWVAFARPAARAQWLLVALSFGCLLRSFVVNDFSVLYVAAQSNSQLPLVYRVAAIWGGHEGSLLLWMLMSSSWTLAVSMFSRALPEAMVARVLGVLGLVSGGLLAFILTTSSPFARLLPAALEGRDLNPLLQDPGLVIHPPMLYMGYVGFSVAFAFAIAALLAGNLDATWARWSRPWTTAAWIFLTLGVALGSGWAYYTLGWGGWWFWDPVENASFIPWLVGTALMHSLAVTEKRGAFKNWTVLLAIAAFSLSLLGTFLVRSGVLVSVHAFATDPRRGIFILAFLALVIGASLLVFAWRAPRVDVGGHFALMSRETLLLTNNVLLATAAGAVLLGTLYPLVMDALNLGKISVGAPYFETVFVPLAVPLLVLVGLGPLVRWKADHAAGLLVDLRLVFALALLGAIALPLAFGDWRPLVALGALLGTWIAAASVSDIVRRLRSAGRPSRAFWGMHTAHIGIAVFVFGVTFVKGYEIEKDVRMVAGDSVQVAGYGFRWLGVADGVGSNYQSRIGIVELSKDGRLLRVLNPQKRSYFSSDMPITDAAIDSGPTRDIYVSIGDPVTAADGSETWIVRLHYKPFVAWIWGGCLMMALGGMVAISDRRYRLKIQPAAVMAPAWEPNR